jgi:hypothetical protein
MSQSVIKARSLLNVFAELAKIPCSLPIVEMISANASKIWKADLSVHQGEVLRYNSICEIGVNSPNYWQQASYLICPFECCLDFDMMEHQYPANKQWLKAIQMGKSRIGDENHGLSRLKLFQGRRIL